MGLNNLCCSFWKSFSFILVPLILFPKINCKSCWSSYILKVVVFCIVALHNVMDTSVWKDCAAGFQLWRWRQHGHPECWSPATTLHSAATQKTITSIFTTVKTSNLLISCHIFVKILCIRPLSLYILFHSHSIDHMNYYFCWAKHAEQSICMYINFVVENSICHF